MNLTVLGSGTIVPSLHRQTASYLVRENGQNVLLDCGAGAMRRLLQAGSHPDEIDLILISHIHLDHTSELPLLLFSARWSPSPRSRLLRLAGSGGFMGFFAELERLYGDSIAPERYARRLELLAPGSELRAGDLKIRCGAARHTPSSLAFRVEDASGASLVYTGDTEYCPEIVELARGCTLLLCECSFPDGEVAGRHLSPSLAGRIASEAGAQRLLLTHFYPACESVDRVAQTRRTFSGEVLLAEDLLEVSVGARS